MSGEGGAGVGAEALPVEAGAEATAAAICGTGGGDQAEVPAWKEVNFKTTPSA